MFRKLLELRLEDLRGRVIDFMAIKCVVVGIMFIAKEDAMQYI